MTNKAAISLTTGTEELEKVTAALLVAVDAAEAGREILVFVTQEAARLATAGIARGVAGDGCPPLGDLLERYRVAAGKYLVCSICFDNRGPDKADLFDCAVLGTSPSPPRSAETLLV